MDAGLSTANRHEAVAPMDSIFNNLFKVKVDNLFKVKVHLGNTCSTRWRRCCSPASSTVGAPM